MEEKIKIGKHTMVFQVKEGCNYCQRNIDMIREELKDNPDNPLIIRINGGMNTHIRSVRE